MQTFQRGRDFAAWLGLVPVQHSTGGKQRLGRTSKMGQRDIRRLLIVGAMSSNSVGVAPRCAGGIVAQPHAGAEAFDAGCYGAGEQDGAHCVGDARQAGELQGSGDEGDLIK